MQVNSENSNWQHMNLCGRQPARPTEGFWTWWGFQSLILGQSDRWGSRCPFQRLLRLFLGQIRCIHTLCKNPRSFPSIIKKSVPNMVGRLIIITSFKNYDSKLDDDIHQNSLSLFPGLLESKLQKELAPLPTKYFKSIKKLFWRE